MATSKDASAARTAAPKTARMSGTHDPRAQLLGVLRPLARFASLWNTGVLRLIYRLKRCADAQPDLSNLPLHKTGAHREYRGPSPNLTNRA